MCTWDPRVRAPPLQEACRAAGRRGSPQEAGRGGHGCSLGRVATVTKCEGATRESRRTWSLYPPPARDPASPGTCGAPHGTRTQQQRTTYSLNISSFPSNLQRKKVSSFHRVHPQSPCRAGSVNVSACRLEQADRKLSKVAGGELRVSVQQMISVLNTEPVHPFSGPRHRGAGLIAAADISPLS